jgi:uncharacterized membrane protein
MTDQTMEDVIANLLRAGVALAAALVLAGGAWYVASSGRVPDYGKFHADVHGLGELLTLDWPEKLIEAGLLVLIATPVARVAFSLAAFAVERDRMYVWFTLAVLVVLAYSIGTAMF